MAIDKRLQIYDEQGDLVDYDILASDVKFLPDGKDLPAKLAEMQDEIDDAGQGDGTVTGVKVNGITHDPDDQGVVDIGTVITQHQDISGLATKTEVETGLASKVDKNGTDSLMTAAEHTKLAGIAAGAQVNVINSISVNGTLQTPDQGNVDISVEGGSVESVTVNGTKHTPDTNGDVNLGNLRGQDGNSGVASADGVESVNNLNGGTTDTSSKVYVLGANQGKRLRDQIEYVYQRVQSLYSLMSGLAFTDAKPAASAVLPALDWGNPKHAVTLSLNLTNAVAKHNGVAVNNGASILVEEGSTLTLIVEAASGYALTSVTSSTTGATVTDLGNGTYSVAITMGGSNITLSVTASSATVAYTISYPTLAHIKAATRPTSIMGGGTASIPLEPEDGYRLIAANITVQNATMVSYDNNVLTISNPTGAVAVSANAAEIGLMVLRGYAMKRIGPNIANMEISNKAFVVNGVDQQPKFCVTDYIQVPQGDSFKEMSARYVLSRNGTKYAGESDSIPACWALFNKGSNGVFTLIDSWTSDGTHNNRSYTAAQFDACSVKTALLQALQAGTLYVRAFAMLTEGNGNTIDSSCYLKWGDDYLFRASQAYTLSDDPNDFEPFNLPS